MRKDDLPNLLYKLLKDLGGSALMIVIFREFWKRYEKELKKSGDLFYTWNYDIRWAATELRKCDKMKSAEKSPKGVWEIV